MNLTSKNWKQHFGTGCTFRQFTQWAQQTGAKYTYAPARRGHHTITVYTIETVISVFRSMAATTAGLNRHPDAPDHTQLLARARQLQESTCITKQT